MTIFVAELLRHLLAVEFPQAELFRYDTCGHAWLHIIACTAFVSLSLAVMLLSLISVVSDLIHHLRVGQPPPKCVLSEDEAGNVGYFCR